MGGMMERDEDFYYICVDGPLIGRKIQESHDDGEDFLIDAGKVMEIPRAIFEDVSWVPVEGEAYLYGYERESDDTVALSYVDTILYDPDTHG
jgi:hypothetical protein